jgi:hypothetical protein
MPFALRVLADHPHWVTFGLPSTRLHPLQLFPSYLLNRGSALFRSPNIHPTPNIISPIAKQITPDHNKQRDIVYYGPRKSRALRCGRGFVVNSDRWC